MSRQIDDRIVRMTFENDKFEKNVSTTMSTLDKLKDKLLLKKSDEGFKKLQKSADDVSFEHLLNSVDKLQTTLQHRTGILGGIFEELGHRIVNIFDSTFGKVQSMINQVTFEPIMTGLSEYELKINSVQVIASNTGVLMRDAMRELKGETYDAADAADGLADALTKSADEASEKIKKASGTISDSVDTMQAAYDVMMGTYGAGEERKELLGDRYKEIQDTVNSLIAETGSVDAALQKLAEAGYTFSGSMTDALGDVSDAMDDMHDSVEYTMDDIDHVLDILNTYADKTIYNYAQMTDGIGKFTVQSVDLYDSLTAVIGFSNLAAFTGTDNMRAMHVMQEAAKGLATGFINFQDWASFSTNGGMGSKEFQDQLIDTAQHLWEIDEAYKQTVIDTSQTVSKKEFRLDDSVESLDAWIEDVGRFNMSLKSGWLTDKVLIQTMHKYANDWSREQWEEAGYTEKEIDDILALGQVAFEAATKAKTFHQMWDAVTESVQSSWTTTWEYIFGKFYDARNLWTAVSDELSSTLGAMNEARNEALRFWASSPFGREKVLLGLSRIYYFIKDAITAVGDAFHNVFGTIEGIDLVRASIEFEKWTRNLEYMEGLIDTIGAVATIFFTILKAGLTIVAAFAMAIGAVFGIEPNPYIFDSIAETSWYIADLITSLLNLEDVSSGAFMIFSSIFDVLKGVVSAIAGVIITLDELSREFLGFSFIDKIKEFVTSIPAYIVAIKDFLLTLKDNEKVKEFGNTMSEFFAKIQLSIGVDVSNTLGTFQTVLKIISAVITFWGIMQGIKFGKGAKSFADFVEKIPSGIVDVFDKLKETFEGAKNFTKSGIIKTIATSFLEIAFALLILSLVPIEKLNNATAAMIAIAACVVIVLKVLGGLFDILPNNTMLMGAGAFALITVGISNLVGALLVLDLLPFDKTVMSLVILAVLIGLVIAILKTMDHARFGENAIKAAIAIDLIALALGGLVILVSILSLIALVNPIGLLIAVGVIVTLTVIIVAVGALAAAFSKSYNGGAVALLMLGMVPFAAAIVALGVLAMIMSTVALVNPEGLNQATNVIIKIAAALTVMMVIVAFMSSILDIKKVISVLILSIALIPIVIALSLMAAACILLSYTPVDKLKTSGIILAALAAFLFIIIEAFSHLQPGSFLPILAMGKYIVSFLVFIGIILGLIWMMSMTDFNEKRAIILFAGVTAVLAVLVAVIAMMMKISNMRSPTEVNRYLHFGGNSTLSRLLESIAFFILAINVSLLLLIASLRKLMEAADQYSQDGQMQQKLTNFFVGLAQAFLDSWGAIVDAVNHAGVSQTLEIWFDSFITHLVNMIGRLGLAIVEVVHILAETIISSIITLLDDIVGIPIEAIQDMSPDEIMKAFEKSPLMRVIQDIVLVLIIIVYGVAMAIDNLKGPILHALWSLVVAIVKFFMYAIAAAAALLSSSLTVDDIAEYFDEFFDQETFIEHWVEGWNVTVSEWNKNSYFANAMNGFYAFLMTPVYIVVSAIDALHEALYNYDKMQFEIGQKLPGSKKLQYPEFKPFEWTAKIKADYESMVGNGDNAWYNLGAGGSTAVKETADALNELADAEQNVSDRSDIRMTLTPELCKKDPTPLASSMFDMFNNIGQESIKGFNAAWDIHSPSEVSKESGEDIAEGAAIGFDNFWNSDKAKGFLTSMKDKIVSSMGGVDVFEQLGVDGASFSPDVQQVINMDTENLGDDLMNGNFGGVISGMGDGIGQTTSDLAVMNDSTQKVAEVIASEGNKFYNDSELLDGVNGLRDDITTLAGAIEKVKVYLNGKTLVGEIITDIDEALAKRSVRSSRGN